MENEPFVNATVLLFDTKLHVRKQTRSILNIIGFWKIEECESISDVRLALKSRRYDLAIFAVLDRDDGVSGLVNDLRRFRCGDDPFLPVILSSWDARLELVRSIIDAGADDFLAHPFSTTDLSDRINALVANRKPFIVTEEYFGPDRRTAEARGNDAGSVMVPNALLARVEGKPELGPNADFIEASLSQLRRVKIRNIARRIWAIADVLYKAYGDPSLPDWIERELLQILKSGRKFNEIIPPREIMQLGSLCDTVIQTANRLRVEKVRETDLELLEQSALALRVASQLGGDSTDAAAEISSALAAIRDKHNDLIKSVIG
ncbi:MAG: response regulator [Alphaproteobacteria bacterium]|nr:response regulator [Alphaproteobacteria bacterium]